MDESGGPSRRERLRVLLVEDHPGDVELTLVELRRGGYDVTADVVSSPAEMAQALSAGRHDVALVDYQLPGWSGIEALEQLKREREAVPVIMVTGVLGDEAAVECIKRGASNYVLKNNLARLCLTIRQSIEERGLRDQRERARGELEQLNTRLETLIRERTSELHVANEKLTVSEERWRSLAENAPNLILIVGRDGTIQFTNSDEDQTVGNVYDFVHPDHHDVCRTRIQQVFETSQAERTESIAKHTDGRLVPYEMHFGSIRNAGEVVAVTIIAVDITLRKEAEEAVRRHRAELADIVAERTAELTVANERLRESEASLAKAQEIARVGSWEWDIVARREHWTPEVYRILGAAPVRPSFRLFLTCVHPDDRRRVRIAHETALTGESRYSLDHRILHNSGEVRVVHQEAEVTFDRTGRPVRMMGTIQDVTNQHALETQLRHAQKMEAVGRLAAGIAHDFNNLLTVTQGYSEQLVSSLSPRAKEHNAADEILRASRRAASLTRQLLLFSRKEAVRPTIVDMNNIVADTKRMLERLIGEDIVLDTRLNASSCYVNADRGQIEQVIVNLAVNARDAMPKGGTLSITTSVIALDQTVAGRMDLDTGPHILLDVSDTGLGMDDETRSNAFEPFFTTKELGKGTGLGLAAVYGIVKQSRGAVSVESELDRGTTFMIYLPRVGEPQASVSSAQPLARELTGSATILMVEDEPLVRNLVRDFLHGQGFTVLVAEDGQNGLQIGTEHDGTIDLLVTDVVMPGLAGGDLASELLSHRPEMKVLYMSGYADRIPNQQDIIEGANTSFLQKPFALSALASSIRKMLDLRG